MNLVMKALEKQLNDYQTILAQYDEEWGKGDLTHEEHATRADRIRLQMATVTECLEAVEPIASRLDGLLAKTFRVLTPFVHPDFCVTLPNNGSMGAKAPLFARNAAMLTVGDCRAASKLQDEVAKIIDGE